MLQTVSDCAVHHCVVHVPQCSVGHEELKAKIDVACCGDSRQPRKNVVPSPSVSRADLNVEIIAYVASFHTTP